MILFIRNKPIAGNRFIIHLPAAAVQIDLITRAQIENKFLYDLTADPRYPRRNFYIGIQYFMRRTFIQLLLVNNLLILLYLFCLTVKRYPLIERKLLQIFFG